MVSKFALLGNVLLISAALAVPSSRLEARLARRRQPQPNNHIESPAHTSFDAQYSSNWAGAAWDKEAGTFTTVTGTFTVPTPSGDSGVAAIWVGIDGNTCGNAILQTGIDFIISYGEITYDVWYEWYPDYSYDFYGISISPGDVITATVTASSTTSGTAAIQNWTTGQNVTQSLTSAYALCGENAEWIVEDFEVDGSIAPLADFGTVTFTGATASGPSGAAYTPSGATLMILKRYGQVLTSVFTSTDTATIQYVYQ